MTYGCCPFCASKGYEKRKLIQSPTGLRCGSCMTIVTTTKKEA